MQNITKEPKVRTVANNIFFNRVKELLSLGNDVLITINGNSMRPFLSHLDKVLISPVKPGDLSLGKVILARYPKGYVLHRLVWKSTDKIWLAGDNNLIQIEEINKEDILGYVKYAYIKGEKVDIHNFWRLLLAGLWFLLRPLRLVVFKFKRLF